MVMAAINGSTGSSARLSVGLSGSLNGVSPRASRFHPSEETARAVRDTAPVAGMVDEGRGDEKLGVFFHGPQDASRSSHSCTSMTMCSTPRSFISSITCGPGE